MPVTGMIQFRKGRLLEKFFLLSFLTGLGSLRDFRKGRVPNVLILFGTAAFGIAGFIRGRRQGTGAEQFLPS